MPIQNQLIHIYQKIDDAMKQNPQISKSVFGNFHTNFNSYYIKGNKKLFEENGEMLDQPTGPLLNKETVKARNKIIGNCFKSSKILKRDTDKILMYYNMPKYLIELNFVPTKIFP